MTNEDQLKERINLWHSQIDQLLESYLNYYFSEEAADADYFSKETTDADFNDDLLNDNTFGMRIEQIMRNGEANFTLFYLLLVLVLIKNF